MQLNQIQNHSQTVSHLQKRDTIEFLRFLRRLITEYGKNKNKEHKVEIKVNGKSKFKAVVDKAGTLKVSKNDLTADEIAALQNHFKSIPNPPINPKDFDVMVDGQNVLKTQEGRVVHQAQPLQSSEVAEVEEKAQLDTKKDDRTPDRDNRKSKK
ncbi:MAG: hypothetical protein HC852_23815 [Acaryochloridaceae cyanobacterium RU_4_10]|nr:hypothetical protein [Acaryochloridaceae cyanobacterium RU_4_10]